MDTHRQAHTPSAAANPPFTEFQHLWVSSTCIDFFCGGFCCSQPVNPFTSRTLDRAKHKSVPMRYLSIRFWGDTEDLFALLDIFNATPEGTWDICCSCLDPFTRAFVFSWFLGGRVLPARASLVHFAAFKWERTDRVTAEKQEIRKVNFISQISWQISLDRRVSWARKLW